MLGTPGHDSAEPGSPGLSYVFHRMPSQFREDVVKRALTSRDRVSANARDALSRAVSKFVSVDGFRNAGIAPPARLLNPLTNQTRLYPELAAAVLRVWAESHEELRELVSGHLETRGIALQNFDFPGPTIRFPRAGRPLLDAFNSFEDFPPDVHEDEVALLMEALTGTVMMFDDPELELELEPDFDLKNVPDLPTADLVEDTLDILEMLPADSPEWEDVIPGFVERLNELVTAKQAERRQAATLDNLLAEICEQYADLTQFFEWNTGRWFSGNVLTGVELGRPYDLAVELRELLSQYAPIQERAPSAAEEIRRNSRRAELLPRIMQTGASLNDLMEPGRGPDGGAVDAGAAGDGNDADGNDNDNDEDGTQPARLPGGGPNAGPAANVPQPEVFVPVPDTGPSAEPPEPAAAGDEGSPEARYPGAHYPDDRFTEVPPCQIEDYLLLRLENQDLEKENDDLENEVQSLKEQLFESRNVGEGFRLALAHQDNVPAVAVAGEEDDQIEDVNSAVELAKARFDGKLLFHFNSESTIEDNSFKWPEQVWRALQWLGTSYYESRVGLATNPDLDGSCRLASGMWYKTSQHDTTMAQFPNSYTTRVDGRRIRLGEHIGKGTGFDPRRTIRIGFDWDRTLQKVIIGYLGQHQRTAAS